MLSTTDLPIYQRKADLFKGLAHPYRIRALEIIDTHGEVSAGQIVKEMDLEASHVSQHLKVLRKFGLVSSQREGLTVLYRLAFPEVADFLLVSRSLLNRMAGEHA
ncbi:ArsR/SmtB family transcription factor [Corynebacterium crudilactis]|uniref:Transcriptional regulator n=1 Tax=Corynebacterium crudilactis TaxID=1652495 RepID=A0A172QS55_9CORY|nr:metalloregulator ArsR/SmtB family transcription factor [Corynebacterium crudilactis]ANE03514.1 transcriptional regulator [Corynebacterium crudilactis]